MELDDLSIRTDQRPPWYRSPDHTTLRLFTGDTGYEQDGARRLGRPLHHMVSKNPVCPYHSADLSYRKRSGKERQAGALTCDMHETSYVDVHDGIDVVEVLLPERLGSFQSETSLNTR